jgi:hypothetical protein
MEMFARVSVATNYPLVIDSLKIGSGAMISFIRSENLTLVTPTFNSELSNEKFSLNCSGSWSVATESVDLIYEGCVSAPDPRHTQIFFLGGTKKPGCVE